MRIIKQAIGLILTVSSLILLISGKEIPNITIAIPMLTQGIALLETEIRDEEDS